MKYKAIVDGRVTRYFNDVADAWTFCAIKEMEGCDVKISKHRRTFASPIAFARSHERKGLIDPYWDFNEI